MKSKLELLNQMDDLRQKLRDRNIGNMDELDYKVYKALWEQYKVIDTLFDSIDLICLSIPSDTKCNDGKYLADAEVSALATNITLKVLTIRNARKIRAELKGEAW